MGKKAGKLSTVATTRRKETTQQHRSKRCSGCGRRLANTAEFFQSLGARGGLPVSLSAECRDCRNKRYREYYQAHRTAMIARATARARVRRKERKAIKQAERHANQQLYAKMKAAAARQRCHINANGSKECIGCTADATY